MADIALEQLLHTAGDNTLSQTDGALHGYMRGTDGTTTRTVKTDADGRLIASTIADGAIETLGARSAVAKTDPTKSMTLMEAIKGLMTLMEDGTPGPSRLAQIQALLADPATAAKQDAAKAVLDAISTAVATRATEATLAQIKTALTDGTLKAQLSGRKAKVEQNYVSETLNVAPGGSAAVIVTPPAGALWKVQNLHVAVSKPNGATTGTHSVTLKHGYGYSTLDFAKATSKHDADVRVVGSMMETATSAKWPTTEIAQLNSINGRSLTQAMPLYVYYLNSTDASQTGALTITLVREVEYIND